MYIICILYELYPTDSRCIRMNVKLKPLLGGAASVIPIKSGKLAMNRPMNQACCGHVASSHRGILNFINLYSHQFHPQFHPIPPFPSIPYIAPVSLLGMVTMALGKNHIVEKYSMNMISRYYAMIFPRLPQRVFPVVVDCHDFATISHYITIKNSLSLGLPP